MIVAVDFETYYNKDYSVAELGNYAYTHHEFFNAYMVAIYTEEGNFVGTPADFDWSCIDGEEWWSHNANFDKSVWERLVELGKIESKGPKTWSCSADMMVYLGFPRTLASIVALETGTKLQKSVRDKEMKKYTATEAKEKGLYDSWLAYCLEDARATYNIVKKYKDQWSASEQVVSLWNRKQSDVGIQIDVPLLEQYLNSLYYHQKEVEKQIPWDWSDNTTPLSTTRLAEHCRSVGIEPPPSTSKEDPALELWLANYGYKYMWPVTISEWRSINALAQKLQTLKRGLDPHGVYHHSLKYFGGHTGRFSGAGGFNLQNLPRTSMYDCDIRKLIIPRKGRVLLILDFAQIEPRILAWLAGDLNFLAQCQTQSIYEAHARASMGWKGGKLKEENPEMYSLAKARVLGLGYGCGSAKFIEVAWTMAQLKLTEMDSKRAVDDYRARNPKVTALWSTMQNLIRRSVKDRYMEIELPSGRTVRYFDITSHLGLKAKTERGGVPQKMYGGKIVENICQAIGRDILVDKGLHIDALYPQACLFHVHDEFVLEVDEDRKDEFKTNVIAIAQQPLSWMPGLPLAVECTEAKQYTK